MEILDARGLSCPEPVIMLSKAMMSKENKYQMIVDSPTAQLSWYRHNFSFYIHLFA